MNTTTQPLIFKTNSLYYWANKYLSETISEREIETIDRTNLFLKEIENYITNKELIKVAINGNVRKGKSTLGFKIGKIIMQYLKIHGKTTEEFGLQNIARDQQEYSKIMRDPKIMQTVLVTDENNELEKGGENVTAEKALLRVFSEVQAARYVHTVHISPKDIMDDGSDILIEIIQPDRKRQITHAKLYYRIFRQGITIPQLVGYINIDVSDIIKNWIKIEEIFLKKNKTPKEEKQINDMAKKDWYIEYMIKKHEKMELITKEGIFRPRILDYATPILETVRQLRTLTKTPRLVTREVVKSNIKMQFRERKIPTSIIGIEEAAGEAKSILGLYESYYQLLRVIDEEKQRKNKTEKTIETEKELIEQSEATIKSITAQMAELEHYEEINKRYNRKISDEK